MTTFVTSLFINFAIGIRIVWPGPSCNTKITILKFFKVFTKKSYFLVTNEPKFIFTDRQTNDES